MRLKHHKNQTITGHHAGFTLIEMMVVVAVIALLAVMTTPSLTRMRVRETSREYAANVANQLKLARMQAKTQGQPLMALITPGDGSPGNYGSIVIKRGSPYCRSALGTTPSAGLCDDNMPPKPPVTCAELNQQINSLQDLTSETIAIANPQGISANDYIAGTSLGNTPVNICLAPDGRILAANGSTLSAPAGTLCSGENFMIYTVNTQIPKDRVRSTDSIDDLAKCGNNDNKSAARDEVNLYRIIMPYNGAIRSVQ